MRKQNSIDRNDTQWATNLLPKGQYPVNGNEKSSTCRIFKMYNLTDLISLSDNIYIEN